MKFKHHHIAIFLLLGTIFVLLTLIISNIYSEALNTEVPAKMGVSFSPSYAKDLGLDPKKTYISILSDLHIKNVRLMAYWDEIEYTQDSYDFSDLDFYLGESAKKGVRVYLAVGYKVPRWPECRAPKWLDNASTSFRQERQLKFVTATISKYNNNPEIAAFQIENEPLLQFGMCPPPDKNFLIKEVAFVRTQTQKPIILTDSGELRSWVTPMKLSDIFGTTLYRVVKPPLIGNTKYPLQPWYYRVKSNVIRKLFAPNNKKTIIVELQSESWSNKPLIETPIQEQLAHYSLEDFKETFTFARKVGFDEIYLWGVEWWYYMAKKGHPEYLEYAKGLF